MDNKEKNEIQHPEAWELIVSVCDKQVDYLLFTPSVNGSLIVETVARADATLQSLEDVVYDTPALLNDYKRVRVIVRTNRFVLLPQNVGDEECLEMVRMAFPGDDSDAAVCLMPSNGVKAAYLMPHGVQAFLGRTFNYPEVYPHLMPLCEHFKELNRSADLSRMFVHLSDGHMDLAVYRDDRLLCANSYPFTEAQDAAYFALNAWRTHGLDQLTDELQLSGDAEFRALMTPVLREYVKFVMPADYPAAAMRLGRNVLRAPLESVLLALCE